MQNAPSDHTDGLRLERRADGQIWMPRDDKADVAVRACPCFPWTQPGRYVSLRDNEDGEMTFVTDLAELDDETRALMEEALAEAGFVLEITRVDAIDTEFEIRNWRVQTRQGPFTFQTKLDDWPRAIGDGGLLLRDVAGNLLCIPDPHALDAPSRKRLWAFVD